MNAKAKTTDLTELDDEGLHAILEEQDEIIRAAGAVKQTVKAERDRRAVAELAAGLSDTQRSQLAQVLTGVGGIDSTEGVGTPA
jgi:hypothetical protein